MMDCKQKFCWLVLMIGFLASGCTSVSFMYDYGNFVARWEIDNYFDTDSKQDALLKERIATLLNWHKSQELPHYTTLLEKIEQAGGKPLSQEELEQIFTQYKLRRNQLIAHLIPGTAVFLASLSSEQLAYFRDVLESKNQELQEKNNRSLAIRLEEEMVDWEEDFSAWFGSPTEDQRRFIEDWYQQRFLQGEDPDQSRLQRRQKAQVAFFAFMETSPNAQQVEDWLENWMLSWTRKQTLNKSLVLQLDALLTDEQRQFALKRIQGYKEEIQDVIPHLTTLATAH